jgi:Asp-tRNA(Asn)/Glu-tRNA(Gln) amidotransferase A subunit family amidase
MAKTVTDIALVLDATVGFDPADPVTAMGQRKNTADPWP